MRAKALLAAVLAAGALGAQPARTPLSQSDAESAVAAVVPDLESIRGISFKKKVTVTVIDDARARTYALSRFRRMTPDAKIRSDETVYHLLGLVSESTDLVRTLLDVLEEQAGGYYDPESKSFYLLDDMPKDMTPLLTAHEMTHALEDQSYDIDGRLMKLADNDDATFALSAVVEGSATAAAAVFVARAIAAGKLDPSRAASLGDTIKSDRLNAMPAALRRELLGPYVLGTSFLTRGHIERLQHGFPRDDVNAAWAHPPKSSEQILHPEKYWDPELRDDPKPVTLRDPSRILGAGWQRSGSGVLGELTLGSLVGASAPEASDLAGTMTWTNSAASGWGGDRFELWTKGESAVVLIGTVWDTVGDAQEFAAALKRLRPALGVRQDRATVGIVAGGPDDRRGALLSLLVRP